MSKLVPIALSLAVALAVPAAAAGAPADEDDAALAEAALAGIDALAGPRGGAARSEVWADGVVPELVARGVLAGPDAAPEMAITTLAEAEAFRDEVDGFLAKMEVLMPELLAGAAPSGAPGGFDGSASDAEVPSLLDVEASLAILSHARTALQDVPATQMAIMQEEFAAMPGFWNLPDYLVAASAAHGQETLAHAVTEAGFPVLPTPDPLPTPEPAPSSVPKRSSCSFHQGANLASSTCDDGCPPNIDTGTIATPLTIGVVAIAAELAVDLTPGDTELVTFPGVGITIVVTWKAIPGAIAWALKAAAFAQSFQYALNDACEENYHRGITHFYLDEKVSSRASQDQLDMHHMEQLSQRIQANLLDTGNRRVAIFQLPESVCGLPDENGFRQCGLLEQVDLIVAESITETRESSVGLDNVTLNQAVADYEAARAARMAAPPRYKESFSRYRDAYQGLVAVLSDQDVTIPIPSLFASSQAAVDRVLRYGASTGLFLGALADPSGSPGGLAVGSDTRLYVGVGNRVVRYETTDGSFVDTFVTDGALSDPKGLAFDEDGELYVSTGNQVRVYSAAGAHLRTISTGLSGAWGVTIGPDVGGADGDRDLYVSSANNGKVIIYDRDTGAVIHELPNTANPVQVTGVTLSRPAGIAEGPDIVGPPSQDLFTFLNTFGPPDGVNEVFVSSNLQDMVIGYEPTSGQPFAVMRPTAAQVGGQSANFRPTGLAFGPDANDDFEGDLYVASDGLDEIVIFDVTRSDQSVDVSAPITARPFIMRLVFDRPETTMPNEDESGGLDAVIDLVFGPGL